MKILAQFRHFEGEKPEGVHPRCRVLGGEVLDPAEEGRLAHLDVGQEDLVKREEDRNLDQDWQAAGKRIGAFFLVERHHFLVQALLVVAEAFAQLDHLGLQLLHLRHGYVGLVGEREEDDLNEDRHN